MLLLLNTTKTMDLSAPVLSDMETADPVPDNGSWLFARPVGIDKILQEAKCCGQAADLGGLCRFKLKREPVKDQLNEFFKFLRMFR